MRVAHSLLMGQRGRQLIKISRLADEDKDELSMRNKTIEIS